MFSASNVYSWDIETDTTVDGLDPRVARITEIVVATNKEEVVLDDADEVKLIGQFDDYVCSLEPGLLVGWNDTFFDLPFVWSRWHGVDGAGVEFVPWDQSARGITGRELGMHPIAQPELRPKYDYLPGYNTGLGCVWSSRSNLRMDVHQHLDISFAYKRVAAELGVRHGLKPVCEALGIPMITVDRERMHDLTPAERHDYVVSDGRGTRELALRLLGAEQ